MCISVALFMSTQIRFHMSSSPLSRSMSGSLRELCLTSERLGEQRGGRMLAPYASKLHQQGPLKGSCTTCFLRELFLVCRACVLAQHLGPPPNKSEACPEHPAKITPLLSSLPLCLLPLIHSSPLHLPPLSVYFLPSLLHHDGRETVLLHGSLLYSQCQLYSLAQP